MSNNPKRYSVDFTLGEVIDLVNELKRLHSGSSYEIERVLTETPEELGEKTWYVSQANESAAKRARVAGLIHTITGEPFGDADEVTKVAAAVKAYEAWKVAEAAKAEAVEVGA